MNDIVKIIKAKKLGIIKALKIYKQSRKHSYQFSSFTDIDKTYNIIHKLWKNISPHAKEDIKSSEEDNDNATGVDETMTTLNRGSQVTERARTGVDLGNM